MSNTSNNKSKFTQKSFWTFHANDNREFLILIELDAETDLPISTSIVPAPPRILLASKYSVILN